MIKIERHIEILLLSNDCVILPGLGGFMAHHVDARIDKSDNMFLPPLRALGFNPQLTMNDSLLVQSYIETYDVSYPEALRMVENDVDELRQHIDTEGEYELNGIGILSRNDEGKLLFEPCEAGVLTPEYYGLGGFQIPLSSDIQDVDEATIASVSQVPIKAKSEHDVIVIKMSWLRNAVAVAAAIIAFLMIGTPVTNSTQQATATSQSSFIPVVQHSDNTGQAIVATDASSAVVGSVSDSDVATNIDETEVQAEGAQGSEALESVEQSTLNAEFCIVMASHVSERNAIMYIEQLKSQGYNDTRMWVNSNHVRRVVYGSFDNEADAESTLQQLRSENRLFRDTWITEIK